MLMEPSPEDHTALCEPARGLWGVVTRRPHPLKSTKSHQYGSSFLVQRAPIDASASARYQSSSLCPHLDGGVRLEPVELPTHPRILCNLSPDRSTSSRFLNKNVLCAHALRLAGTSIMVYLPRYPDNRAFRPEGAPTGDTCRMRDGSRTHHSPSYRRNTYS